MKPQKNIIIACTGSVATIKMPLLIQLLRAPASPYDFNVKIILTEHAKHFLELPTIPQEIPILDDRDEWISWNNRGDPVMHIELGKWADILLIAPLSANSLAKIATGICDNLIMCVVRAWNFDKPVFFCPAMNTRMYDHPITREQIAKLTSWGYREIPCVSKTLMCGDTGNGAMAEVQTIVTAILSQFQNY